MSSLKLHKLINSDLINYILIFIFFLYSVYVIKHHYDGHHLGLLYSNALDLIKGKIPYKDIFIQYGFLTTLIHSLILIFFDNQIFFISFCGVLFYSFSILFISLSIKKLINSKYGLISSILILFNHPIPFLPWSNYIVFFFITLSIFLITKKNINYFFLGIFISLAILSRQDVVVPILSSFIIFIILIVNSFKKKYFIYFVKILIGFLLPIFLLVFYLIYFDIFSYWKSYLIIPKFYLDIYGKGTIEIILDFIFFFSTKSFFNFIVTPQLFLISIILFSNSIIIFLKLFNKINVPYNILYISILSILLCSMSLKIEIFRLYTSVIIGIIPLLYFLNEVIDKNVKKNLLRLLILPSLFSIFFYPFGNNDTFDKTNLLNNDIKINNKNFSFYKWPKNKTNSINLITEIVANCDVAYLENLTFDSLYSTIGNFDRVSILPYKLSSIKHNKFHNYINTLKNPDMNYIDKINLEIQKENLILLVNKNNNVYKNSKIEPTIMYSHIKINESLIEGKPDYLNIFVPNKCLK